MREGTRCPRVPALGDVLADRAHRLAAVGAGALSFGHVELDGLARKVLGELRAAVTAVDRGFGGPVRGSWRLGQGELERGSLSVQIELARVDPFRAPTEQALLQDRELFAQDLVLALKRDDLLICVLEVHRDHHARKVTRAPSRSRGARDFVVRNSSTRAAQIDAVEEQREVGARQLEARA
jgi:hypothetical protein